MPKQGVSSSKKNQKKTISKSAKPAASKVTTKKPIAKASVKKPAAKVLKPIKTASKTVKSSPSLKKKKVAPIPKGYNHVIPHISVDNTAKAIEFYKKVFAAKENFRLEFQGKISHAEIKIGTSMIMIADKESTESTKNISGSIGIHLYTKDVDNTVKVAVTAGAKIIKPVENLFYGDRAASIEDPFGNTWHIASRIENLSPATQKKRALEFYSKK